MKATFSVATISLAAVACIARGQTCSSTGPDAIIGQITTTTFNAAASNGIDATSFGTHTCNIGDAIILCRPDFTSRHPVQGQNLFRLSWVNGVSRFEQLGQAFVFHHFFELTDSFCCSDCVPPQQQGDLGVHCSTSDSSAATATQSYLGPKWQIDAATAAFPYPPANPPHAGSLDRRLRFRIADVDPALNPGALFFGEVQILAAEDAAAQNAENNASYRRCTISVAGGNASVFITGTTQVTRAAIRAWKDNDPAVAESEVHVPGDGLFIIAAKMTNVGGGYWHYEYAVQNLNSDRSAQSFTVALDSAAAATEVGFHDVDYHSGDGEGNVNRDGTDWSFTHMGGAATWATQTFAENSNGNALRWGTLYNFRLVSNVTPRMGQVELGLFKPGTPTSVLSGMLPVPSTAFCPPDFDGDGFVTGADYDLFIQAFEAGATGSDSTRDGFVTGEDFDWFVQWYEIGC